MVLQVPAFVFIRRYTFTSSSSTTHLPPGDVPSLLPYKSTPQGYTTVTNTKTICLRVIDLRVEHLYSGSCPSTFHKIIGHHTQSPVYFNLTPFLDIMKKHYSVCAVSLWFCRLCPVIKDQLKLEPAVSSVSIPGNACARYDTQRTRVGEPLQDGKFRILHRVITEWPLLRHRRRARGTRSRGR